MSNPITHCLERLNLEDDVKVRQRTEQFHGQLSSVPAKFFDKGPYLKVVICIQLAYESLDNLDWDIELGSRLAGCTTSAYEKALSLCRKQLDIRPTVTFEALTVALGSTTMQTPVKELWDNVVQEYPKRFTGVDKVNATKDLELAAWKGAAVFCCAKAYGETLSKDRLRTLCFCTKSELSKCIKTIEITCLAKLYELKVKSRKSIHGKQRRTQGKEVKDKKAEKSTPQPMDVDGANDQKKVAPSDTMELNNQLDKTSQRQETAINQAKAASNRQREPSNRQKEPSSQQDIASSQQQKSVKQQKAPVVKASKPTTKRKGSEMDVGVEDAPKKKMTRPVSGIVSMINEQDYTTTKRYLDFCQWKSAMIDQLQRAN
ncbi:unnamed protein product [Mucor circinelloides]